MSKRSSLWVFLVVAVLLAAFVAGCGGESSSTTQAAGGGAVTTVPTPGTTTGASTATTAGAGVKTGGNVSYYISEPAYIDPYNTQESEGTKVESNVFDSLVTFDPLTSEIQPAVAESWEPNADATVWTFHLRQGTKFHNGREVVAEDFVYAWTRIVDPANKSDIGYHLAAIKGFDEMQAGTATTLAGVVAKDNYTLEVTLSYAFADFEYVVGHPSLAPVPKEEVDKDPKAFLDMPIGNGPFKLTEPWKHEQYIKLARFDDYYGEKAKIDTAEFRIFKDVETAYTEFKAGNLDFVSIPTGQIKATQSEYGLSDDGLTANPGKQTLNGPELATYFVWVNTEDQSLKNVDLRRAISLAINRQAIAETVYEGTRVPATGAVTKGVVGYQDNAWTYAKYDVEQAKTMLEKAGFPNGEGLPTLKLSFNTGAGHEKVMQLMQADLAKIGIKVEFDGHEFAEYTSSFLKSENGKFVKDQGQQLARLGWIADYPIMDNFLFPLFESKSGDNKALYKNPTIDEELAKARSTTDADQRIALYQQIEKTVGEDVPIITIVNYAHRDVASDRVHNFIYSPQGLTPLELCWVD